jgi:signal transduction histidine kinase
LLGNASKFTFEGYLAVKVSFADEWLETEVLDTGIGISQDDLSKLFKFFGSLTKTKDINRGGMGLGLTISKLIL